MSFDGSKSKVAFYGRVDGFDAPHRIRGYATLRRDNVLDTDIEICAARGASVLGRSQPSVYRKDITGDAREFSGWVIDVEDENLLGDFSDGLIRIYAETRDGLRFDVPIWDVIAQRTKTAAAAARAAARAAACATVDDDEAVRIIASMRKSTNVSDTLAASLERLLGQVTRSRQPSGSTSIAESRTEYSSIALPVGFMSADNSAVLGRAGHLFLVEGSNSVLARYSSPPETVRDLSEQWLDLFARRCERISAAGSQYRQMVIPDKISVIPQYFPMEIQTPTPLLAQIESQYTGTALVKAYYVPVLTKMQEYDDLTCCKTDSHQNAFGSFIILRELLKSLGIEEAPEPSFEGSIQHYLGDLGRRMVGSPISETLSAPQADFGSEPRLVSSHDGAAGNTGTRRVWRNETAAIKKTVVAFGNSCFERGVSPTRLSWWMSRLFAEFHFVWGGGFDEEYCNCVKPDYVICQTVERFLFQRLPEH